MQAASQDLPQRDSLPAACGEEPGLRVDGAFAGPRYGDRGRPQPVSTAPPPATWRTRSRRSRPEGLRPRGQAWGIARRLVGAGQTERLAPCPHAVFTSTRT